jgi:hypothetical protein
MYLHPPLVYHQWRLLVSSFYSSSFGIEIIHCLSSTIDYLPIGPVEGHQTCDIEVRVAVNEVDVFRMQEVGCDMPNLKETKERRNKAVLGQSTL